MKLKNRVVVITGASVGIGAATAILFAKEGAKIVINYRKNEKGAKNVASEIESINGEAVIYKADVSNPLDVKKLFDFTLKTYSTIDILINNAGHADEPDFLKAKKEDWINAFESGIFSTMLCSQHAANIMLKKDGGRILNTSTIYALEKAGRETLVAYSASKAAINSLTQTLAKVLGPKITVNAVAPGYTNTLHWDDVPEETKKYFIGRTVLKKWVLPEDVAEAFLYLATADSITGEILTIDAGRTLIDY